MKVVLLPMSAGRQCYVVLNSEGQLVISIARYLKYLTKVGVKLNSIRSKAYALAIFFRYCREMNLDANQVHLDDFAGFILYLKNPYRSTSIYPCTPMEQGRSPRTINLYMSAVIGFYDYLYRSESCKVNHAEIMETTIPARFKTFKNFLHHITKGDDIKTNIMRQPVPKRNKPLVLEKKNVLALHDACENNRDRMLITLLFESGMRIGEVLGLRLEDIDVYNRMIHIIDRGTLPHGASTKSVYSVRDLEIAPPLMNKIQMWIAGEHPVDCTHDYLFINLKGPNKNEPLNYWAVVSLFRRLKKKTGVDAHAHLFRHTHLTILADNDWTPEMIQKRAGHKNYQTTFDTYVHVSENSLHEAWQRTRMVTVLHEEEEIYE